MERVFSVEGEEIPNLFWAPPPVVQPQFVEGGVGGAGGLGLGGVADGGSGGGSVMDNDWTECGLQKFLEDALLHADGPTPLATNPDDPVLCPNPVVELSTEDDDDSDVEVVKVIPAPASAPVPASEVTDPVAYNAMLRRKLNADLTVVALWKASGGGGSGENLVQNEDVNVISSSSRDSDDDIEGETEKMENINVTAHRAKRRKESNRESARCSTSRKQAHLTDVEDQLSDLKVKNNSLLRHLTRVVQKSNDYADDCRVLRAKVKTLETKLKMAEHSLMTLTGTTNVDQAISAVSSIPIPFISYPPDNTAASSVSVPIHDAPVNYFTTPAAAHNGLNYIPQAAPGFQIGDLAAASPQVHPVSSMGHVWRTVLSGEPSAVVSRQSWGATLVDPNELPNMRMQ